ncbi:MAG: hypothetical protein KGP35_03365 [Bacteroidetes bacterium]|nr:hypothetical protein [Bacteroidota bacterium]
MKYELQNVISGISDPTAENLIQAAAHYLRESQKAGRNAEKTKLTKEQETEKLTDWINANQFWFTDHDESRFIARGAEQKVYLYTDDRYVYKLNGSIFYEYWLDYFHSLLIHNYFFPQTSYQLIGFFRDNNDLLAVVKQPYISITQPTDISSVRQFLNENGFLLKKNNDYFNIDAGIILEDLHDENVLTQNDVLFFIDTVFYLTESFFEK